jgi:taurine transport system permease protein
MWWLVTTPIGEKPIVAPLFLPSPGSVWDTFLMLIKNGYQGKTLWFHLGISLFRFGLAFTLTVLVAVPLGLWMGMN